VGRRSELLRAALKHVVSVETWQSLVQQNGLEDSEAIDLLVGMVQVAVGLKDSPTTAKGQPWLAGTGLKARGGG